MSHSAEKNRSFADITGQRFNRLTALWPLALRSEKGNVIWHCRCDCGNEVDVSYNELAHTHRQSCGCQKKEHDEQLHGFLTHVDGTSVDLLKSKKIPSHNTTGVKGVYFIRGRYVAKIVFQNKQYHLGSYACIEDAASARKAAEERLATETVRQYERWKKRAEADPAWARENPVQIRVERIGSGLSILFLPIMDDVGVVSGG